MARRNSTQKKPLPVRVSSYAAHPIGGAFTIKTERAIILAGGRGASRIEPVCSVMVHPEGQVTASGSTDYSTFLDLERMVTDESIEKVAAEIVSAFFDWLRDEIPDVRF